MNIIPKRIRTARTLWLVLCLCPSLYLTLPVNAAPTDTDGLRLDKVVLVMRHGIRPPTDSAALQAWSAHTWPTFNTADGLLTAHGYAATVLLGHWQRQYLDSLGLFAVGQCPDAQDTFVWASPSSRTKATGAALLEGMFPGCGITVHHEKTSNDRLFHSIESGLAPLDPERTRSAMLAAMGGSPQVAQQRYAAAVLRMQTVAGVPDTCPKGNNAKACTLSNLPWELKTKGTSVKLSGPLGVGAAMSESFRMQYAEGLPLDEVAFGQGRNAAAVARLMQLRSAKYALNNHVPYIAQRGGSQLLEQVLLGLEENATSQSPGSPPPTKWLAYIGHDSNIAQLRTLLGFNWKIAEYPENDAAPGGTLLFERWVDVHGHHFVRLAYLAQSMDQLRQLTPLDVSHPPYREPYAGLPGAKHSAMIPLETFVSTMNKRIDTTATEPQQYVDQ